MEGKVLNVSEGLARTLHNIEVYQALLESFCTSLLVVPQQLREGVALGDVESITRIAHTLKGTAAMLGAEALSSAAASLERSLRHVADNETILFKVDVTITAVDLVIQGIHAWQESNHGQ